MTTRREYDLLNRLRRVEFLRGASNASTGLPGTRMARMAGDCVAELGGWLESRFLLPYSPELNPDELVWQDLKTNGVGRKPVESAKELHDRVMVHMETLKGLPRKIRSFFKAAHTKYAAI
jgi:hypothetical protein